MHKSDTRFERGNEKDTNESVESVKFVKKRKFFTFVLISIIIACAEKGQRVEIFGKNASFSMEELGFGSIANLAQSS